MTDVQDLHDRRRRRIHEDLDFTSKQLSELSRYVAFGLAAASLGFMSSSSKFAEFAIAHAGPLILWSSALGCVSILFDALQYFFGYLASRNALRNAANDYAYETESTVYRLRTWFFYLKQFAAFFGAVAFVITILSLAAIR